MKTLSTTLTTIAMLCAAMSVNSGTAFAGDKNKAPVIPLTETGVTLEKKYADELQQLRAEIEKILPAVNEQKKAALAKAQDDIKKVEAAAAATQKDASKVQTAKALVDHAKGKWIGDANKNIAKAEAALKKAKTDSEKSAAKADIAKWQKNKEEGEQALKERTAAYEKAKVDEEKFKKANAESQELLTQARAKELKASTELLEEIKSFVSNDKYDDTLIKAAIIASATPKALATFAQQSPEKEALIDKLLADKALMRQMLENGGARYNMYGEAMEIYTAIQKASSGSKSGNLQLLALATCLEHAKPIPQNNIETQSNMPEFVDPVKRYLHYEKAFLAGELDPAFKGFSVWEYRMVLDCDAPDEILSWGREMLRNYRPDHIYNENYGWRYSAAVKTEVPYGSQNVKYDLDSLHKYQNIALNGGICGRRAFFGRFILQSFGIPTWGVTQHKHAALSHWTPKGWVVNLGAGFQHSWWDKDEAPRSGSDFLLESQARMLPKEYLQVLRAQWVSSTLGEQAFNERRKIPGGFWSNIANYQTKSVATLSKAVDLGPLGQELAEANEPQGKDPDESAAVTEQDKKVSVASSGVITVPSVAHSKKSGPSNAAKSFLGGLQMHCLGGFKAEYEINAPRAGKYTLTAKVVTAQKGQQFQFSTNDGKDISEVAVPYTTGKWDFTKPIEISLESGKNILHFHLTKESRGVTVKEFTLTPIK